MGRRSDSVITSLLLVNRITESGAKPLSPGEYWAVVRHVQDPALLLQASDADLQRLAAATGVGPQRIRRLLEAATTLAFELENLEQQGFALITPFEATYPAQARARLADNAPPVLTAVGSIDLLNSEGIGVVGSRDVAPAAVDVARSVAQIAASRRLSVISGGARGIDQQAMAAAYHAGGRVVGFLAESLVRRVRDAETRRAIAEGAACLATPYKPDAGFSVSNAMGRNKLIYAAARATLVISSDAGRGGTWAGAIEALQRDYGVVAVWIGNGAGPGNAELVERGAVPVSDLDDVSWFEGRKLADSEQLRLDY